MSVYERKLSTGKEWYVSIRWPQTRDGRIIRERIGPGYDGKERAKIREAQIIKDLRQGRDPSWRVIKPRLFEAVALEFLATYVGIPVEVKREDDTIKLHRKADQPAPALKRDPDTFIHNVVILLRRFDGITRKMANTLLRTARSGVINTARDFSCAIVTAECELLTAAEDVGDARYPS